MFRLIAAMITLFVWPCAIVLPLVDWLRGKMKKPKPDQRPFRVLSGGNRNIEIMLENQLRWMRNPGKSSVFPDGFVEKVFQRMREDPNFPGPAMQAFLDSIDRDEEPS